MACKTRWCNARGNTAIGLCSVCYDDYLSSRMTYFQYREFRVDMVLCLWPRWR